EVGKLLRESRYIDLHRFLTRHLKQHFQIRIEQVMGLSGSNGQLSPWLGNVFIWLHYPGKIGFFAMLAENMKPLHAHGHEIVAAIGKFVQFLNLRRGTNRIWLLLQVLAFCPCQYYTKGLVPLLAFSNHQAIPWLKDMQGQHHAWKKHYIQRKQ